MKKYQTPSLEELSLMAEDMITASGDTLNGIVAPEDQSGASGTQETVWKDAWA